MDLDLRHRHRAHSTIETVRLWEIGTDDDFENALPLVGKETRQFHIERVGMPTTTAAGGDCKTQQLCLR